MNKNKAIHLLLSFLFFLLVYGCGKNERESIIIDDDDDITTYGVEYVINAQTSMDPYATEDELMKTLLLIIVDQNGEIEELFDIELPQMLPQCTVNTHLTPGEKDVYGFANLTQDMRIAVGVDNLAVGQIMPDISTTTLSLVNGYQIDSSQKKWLPMSNRIKYTVTKLSTQRFSMPLFRLVCKVAFTFKNETGYHTTLRQLSLSPLTNSPVYLLPSGTETPNLPAGTTQEEYVYNFDSSYTFYDQEELTCKVYINESQVVTNDWFQLKLTTQRKQETATEERISLTDLSYLNRNDYLPLSIILTDYRLDLTIRSYPPIGGYPAYVVEDTDGYHCHFSGGGPFIIIPSLIRLSDNSVIEVNKDDWTLTYTNASPTLFDEAPVLEDGEIRGSLKTGSSGDALFTISAEITTSANISRVLSYKVYISQ